MFLTSFAVLALLATASMVMAQPGQGGGQRGQGGQGGQGRAVGAQPPGGAGGFQVGGGAMGILAIAEARTALGVTEDQMTKLRPAAPAPGTTPAAPANLTAEERAARTAERAAAARKNLEETLTKDQVTKLDIMVFQRAGGLNSLNPPAAPTAGGANAPRAGGAAFGGAQVTLDSLRALNLTADQTKKFEEAQAALRAATPTRQGGGNAGGPPAQPTAEELAARQKANADFRAAVSALLTDAQKAKAEELMKDVPTFLRPQARTPGAGGANAAPGAGAGNRGAGGTGGANRGAGGGRGAQNN